MSKLGIAMAFVAGAAVGVAATWQYHKVKYERIAQEEIDSVKEHFSNRYLNGEKTPDEQSEPKTKAVLDSIDKERSMAEMAAILAKEKYIDYSSMSGGGVSNREQKIEADVRPYVIHPDNFGEFSDYETIVLTYYSDDILADDNDEIIENIDDIVGRESLKHFGDFEDEVVFVRNDRLKCDYEIDRDNRTYLELVGQYPYKAEV